MFFPALVFLADHRSGLAIFKVLSLSSLVGLTIMYYCIFSEILACSYAKIVDKIVCTYFTL